VGDRFDAFRSLVRRAGSRAAERVRAQPAIAAIRQVTGELGQRRALIPERALNRAALTLDDVSTASVRATAGALLLELELGNGRRIRATLTPDVPRFAARGAKEIVFVASPEEAAGEPLVRAYVATLGGLIARALWGAAAPTLASTESASGMTDREGSSLRVDLRTVPFVRAITGTPVGQTLLEALSVERIDVEDGSLEVRIAFPMFGR
jgi:hypothetical protein